MLCGFQRNVITCTSRVPLAAIKEMGTQTAYPLQATICIWSYVMKILIPLDGSPRALDAVHHALHLHRSGLRASFVLATVQEPDTMYDMLMVPDADARASVHQALGAQAMESAEALFTVAGAAFEREVRSGYPATMLIEIAEDYGCDAIIIAANGKGTLRSALLGSVSQAILHTSTLPVTIVKHREA